MKQLRMNFRSAFAVAIAASALGAIPPAQAQIPTANVFTNTGTANWNGDPGTGASSNWSLNFQPTASASVGVNEVGVINNGGTAFLSSAAHFPVGGVFLGDNVAGVNPATSPALDGTLEIRNGGSLNVIIFDPTTTAFNIDGKGVTDRLGSVRVGGAANTGGTPASATGNLRVLQGGTLSSYLLDTYATAGASGVRSNVQLGGTINTTNAVLRADTVLDPTGVLNIADGVTFVDGSLTTFNTSGSTISTIQVGGTATLAGNATVNFSSAPAIGQPFKLLSATGVGGRFASVTHNQTLATGQVLDVENVSNGNKTEVTVSVENTLVLNVNRGDGTLSIQNPHASGFAFTGYSISSPQGSLIPANWESFADGASSAFVEVNPTVNLLAELDSSPASPASLASGASKSLGQTFAGSEFGTQGFVGGNVAFTVLRSDGRELPGVVNLTGPEFNNLVLQVSTTTGDARITNPSETNVAINGYTIASTSGGLLTGFQGLADAPATGWQEANVTVNRLSELNGAALTASVNPGQNIPLTGIWDTTKAQDLTFQFNDPTLGAFTGIVQYVTSFSTALLGDFNGDGSVNLADYTVWRDNLGATDESALNGAGNGMNGVDAEDYTLWKMNFGNMAPASLVSGASPQAIPEPDSLAMVSVLLGTLLTLRRRSAS